MQNILCMLRCMANDSEMADFSTLGPKEKRVLDTVDQRIIELLQADARMPNNAIAAAVGIAIGGEV